MNDSEKLTIFKNQPKNRQFQMKYFFLKMHQNRYKYFNKAVLQDPMDILAPKSGNTAMSLGSCIMPI